MIARRHTASKQHQSMTNDGRILDQAQISLFIMLNYDIIITFESYFKIVKYRY